MRTIVSDHFLLYCLEGIGETSLDDVEINPHTNDRCNVSACGNSAHGDGTDFGNLWKTIKRSAGRVDITRCIEASAYKKHPCQRVLPIDGKRSQFGLLSILPQAQCLVRPSDIGWDSSIARIELLRPLRIGQRALPFATPAVNPRAIRPSVGVVRLQFQGVVEFRQRPLGLAMSSIKE